MIRATIYGKYEEAFLQYVVSLIKTMILEKCEDVDHDLMSSFIKTVRNDQYANVIDFDVVIALAVQNVVYAPILDAYKLYINDVYYPKTPVLLSELVNIINYGSLSVRGLYIFTDVFSYVSNNINYIYDKYESGR